MDKRIATKPSEIDIKLSEKNNRKVEEVNIQKNSTFKASFNLLIQVKQYTISNLTNYINLKKDINMIPINKIFHNI
jgi:hypothetical protein